MLLKLACGAALLFILAPWTGAWAKGCSVPRFDFVYGSDSQANMVATSGIKCVARINPRSVLASSAVAQNAAHGTAFVEGHSWGYQSRPGFTGTDSFVMQLSGTSYHKGRSGSLPIEGTTNITVAVQVLPAR